MRKLIQLLVLWVGLAGLAFGPASAGAAVTAAQAKQVQLLVRAQLDAFASDDAPRAFSYAATSIQKMFGTPDQFLEMVRASYPVGYRPASGPVLTPKFEGKAVVQPVHTPCCRAGAWPLKSQRLRRTFSSPV